VFLQGKDLLLTEYQLINLVEKFLLILFDKIKFKLFRDIIRTFLKMNYKY